jgi:hypothetical protein
MGTRFQSDAWLLSLRCLAQRILEILRCSALFCSLVIFAKRLAPRELSRLALANCPSMLRISSLLRSEPQCGQMIGKESRCSGSLLMSAITVSYPVEEDRYTWPRTR